MSIATKGLPWFCVVLTSATAVWGQATVNDEPGASSSPNSITAAARERRSINITGDGNATTGRLQGTSGGLVPEFHTVERGDTLWDITGYYFNNPWRWPRVWGLNPQITNPHWIFPDDRVRLLTPQEAAGTQRPTSVAPGQATRPRTVTTPGTVFFRDEGWLDRTEGDRAGTIVGSPEDQMLLSEGDQAYVDFPNRTPRIGEQMTIYQEGQNSQGGDRSSGRVVRVIGTAVVEAWDRDRHMATVRLTESLDAIERGERVAAIPRRAQVVPPVRNTAELRGNIVATTQPRELVGQNMVVFINRGADDGVRTGNRLFVMRRGDAWRQSLQTTERSATGAGIDRDGDGNSDTPPGRLRSDRDMPDEVVGEVTIVEVRPRSSIGLVSTSIVEVEVGDRVEMRRNY